MKAKAQVKKATEWKQAPAPRESRWPFWAVAAAALVAVFWAYGPSLHGEFVFDDLYLSFTGPDAGAPLAVWLRGVRPLMQLSYWFSYQLSAADPFSYHVLNVLIHCATSALVLLIVMRLLEWSGIEKPRRVPLAGMAALLFLLHPAQTEAVAYVAGRSESQSTLFVMAALAVFLYRKQTAITWVVAGEVLALFGLALLTKEQTVALPALLLLTDFWWNPGFSLRGIRGNWKLYAPMAAGAAGAVFYFRDLILHAQSAGFSLKDFTWYQYFFTQCRALWIYMREFVVPVRLNADWDLPISRSILDHGAIFGLIALVAAAIAAWILRRRFPLAAYGFLSYLILMAPTSSILPIQDPIAERRLYFSMLGLLLMVVDLASRIRIEPRELAAAGAVVVLAAAFATHARAAVWQDDLSLWSDTIQKSPDKMRARFQLAFAYYERHEYATAIQKFAAAAQVSPPRADLLLDWGLSYGALHETDKAIEKLQQSAALAPTAHVYSQIGQTYGSAGRWQEALDALNQSNKIDPNYALTYFYRGLVYYNLHQCPQAVADYRRALAIDPTVPEGIAALRQAEACAAAH